MFYFIVHYAYTYLAFYVVVTRRFVIFLNTNLTTWKFNF